MENILNLKSKANLNCSLCEKCCEYRGDIKITPINVLEISNFLKIPISEFLEKYTCEVKDEEPEIVIKGIGEKRECIFNNRENFKCQINKVKPMQCVVFPLVPVDVKRDLFYDSGACPRKTNKKITVNKWVNGNHNIYKKNKNIYLKWIELMEEIQPKWKSFSKENQEEIKKLLFLEYNFKENFEKQILQNFKKVRDIIYCK
jgi:Fe-S-cluster containining protein